MTQVLSLSPVFGVDEEALSAQKFAKSVSKGQKSLKSELIVEQETSEYLNRISGKRLRHGGTRELGPIPHQLVSQVA